MRSLAPRSRRRRPSTVPSVRGAGLDEAEPLHRPDLGGEQCGDCPRSAVGRRVAADDVGAAPERGGERAACAPAARRGSRLERLGDEMHGLDGAGRESLPQDCDRPRRPDRDCAHAAAVRLREPQADLERCLVRGREPEGGLVIAGDARQRIDRCIESRPLERDPDDGAAHAHRKLTPFPPAG